MIIADLLHALAKNLLKIQHYLMHGSRGGRVSNLRPRNNNCVVITAESSQSKSAPEKAIFTSIPSFMLRNERLLFHVFQYIACSGLPFCKS